VQNTPRLSVTVTHLGFSSEIAYDRLADEIASYRTLTTTLAMVGLLVVAISMADLANALTKSPAASPASIGRGRISAARVRLRTSQAV